MYLEGNSDLTKCIPENLFDVPTSDLRALARALNLPTCEETCAWGGALPNPDNEGLVADCEALLAALNSLTVDSASNALDWSTREPIAGWRGVYPGGSPERVIKFEIKQPLRLRGYLSAELARLSSLQILDLSDNRLRGEIWDDFGDLANLHALNLQGNRLTGGIPRELSGLTNLETLDLSDNELGWKDTGKIDQPRQPAVLAPGRERFYRVHSPRVAGRGD